MARLYKQPGTKNWSIAYNYRGKRIRKSLGTSDTKLAKAALKKLQAELERSSAFNVPARLLSAEQMCRDWELHLEARGRNGKPNADRLRRFFRFLGDPEPHDVLPSDIERWKNSRAAKVSSSTVKRDCDCVFSAFRYVFDLELIEKNPAEKIKKPTIPKKLVEFLTIAEVQELLQVAKEFRGGCAYAMIALALHTGLRQAEVRYLNREDIDFKARLVKVRSKEGWTPKTDEEREVPINDELFEILVEFYRENCCTSTDSDSTGRLCHHSSPLFHHDDGSRLGRTFCRKILRDIARLSELKCTWHTLRHTFASLLVQAGAPLFAVSKLLGHASYATTEKHYARLVPAERSREVNLLKFKHRNLEQYPPGTRRFLKIT